MSDDTSEDGILQEMDRVRGDLGGGIDRLGEQVRDMFDWQSYVRAAPLTTVVLTAAAGYLIAPAVISRSRHLTINGQAVAPSGPTFFGSLAGVVGAAVSQAASLYLGNLLTRELATHMSPDPYTSGDSGAFAPPNDLGD